jgi:hypothetical protein
MVPADFPEHIPNLLIMTFQIPRWNKVLDAPGGIIVLEDLQLDTNRKDAINRRRIVCEVAIPKRKIQPELSLSILPLVIILPISALIVQHKDWVLETVFHVGNLKLEPAWTSA